MNDQAAQPPPTEFWARKPWLFLVWLMAVGLSAYGLYLTVYVAFRIPHCPVLVLSAVTWPAIGAGVAYFAWYFYDRFARFGPAISISSAGIVAPGLGRRLVRWDQIAEIVVHDRKLIEVKPCDMSRFSSWPYKLRRLMAAATGYPAICMDTAHLAVRIDDVAAAIVRHAPADVRLSRLELLPMSPVDYVRELPLAGLVAVAAGALLLLLNSAISGVVAVVCG